MRELSRRADGELAGSMCAYKKCRYYARFAASSSETGSVPQVACASHVSALIKGVMALKDTSVIIQEIPGNWYRNNDQLALVDGDLVNLRAVSRR